MRTYLHIGLVGVATAAALLMAAGATAQGETAPAATLSSDEAPVVRVLVESIDKQPVARVVRLRGVSAAAREVTVRAQTGGLVFSDPLRKGAKVAENDILCQIEGGERRALLAEARARLAQAEVDALASEQLFKDGYSSEATVAADRAALAAAQAAVVRIEIDVARLVIRAPFDGVLETDTAEIGALLQPGDTCAELIAVDPVRFVGYASEIEVGELRYGGAIEARLLDGRRVAAEITFIARSADPATRTFRVEATAPNPATLEGGALRAGMTVEMIAEVDGASGHFIPSSALTLDAQGRVGVRLAEETEDGFRAGFTPVSIIQDGADGFWVSGLPDQAAVIVRGQEYVSDGARIDPAFKGAESN